MIVYMIAVFSVLAVICLAALAAQNARKFNTREYVAGGDGAANIKQLALALKDVEKVGAVPDVGKSLRVLHSAYRSVAAKAASGEPLYECEKWIYENYRSVTVGVKRADFRGFAALPHKGEARVLHLADAIAAQYYCRLDAKVIAESVHNFCRYTPLTFEELCALKAAFRAALLKKLAFVARKIRTLERSKKRAEEDREPDFRYSKKEGYLYYFKATGKKIPERFLSANTSVNPENVEFAFAGAMTDYAKTAAAAITSIKALDGIMTTEFVNSLSPVGLLFDRDETYRNCDAESRRQYLAAVASLARYFNAGEYAVAKGALDLAARFDVHFGEIIFDHRYDLRAHLKGRYVKSLKRASYTPDKAVYYASVFVIQTVFALVAGIFLPALWLKICVALLTFAACYPAATYISERVISIFLPRRPVPRMNYESIPDEGRVAVVVSHYLGGADDAVKAAEDLLALQAVNKDANARFYLLCDLPERDTETDPADSAVINALDAYSGNDNFAVLVRKRVRTGKRYGAYERKRGAIADFNEYMLSGDSGKFAYVSRQDDFRPVFAITLDADSRLGEGEVRTAVNTMLHPLNAKYGILAFTSVYSLSSLKTAYSQRFRENSGAETYCNYSDFYFNLCGKSVFCGKGIYRIAEFHEKTSCTVPDGRVLSHDVLEGALTDTGSLNLATAEDAPVSFVSESARRRRWLRGDLLLLPFVGKKYCRDGIYSYIILKNAFSALAPIATAALWFLALYYGYFFCFAAVFFASFSAPLASLAIAFSSAGGTNSRTLFLRVVSTVAGAAEQALLAPYYAVENLFVIAGTFADYVFAPYNLLRWKPFARFQTGGSYRAHAAVVLPSCIAVAVVAAALYGSVAVSVYCALSIVTVNALYFLGRQYEKHVPDGETWDELTEYARRTFGYFRRVTEDALPCDNIQIYPQNGKSATTSPTNIGFTLLSHVCAEKLGFESTEEAVSGIEKLISVCERLQKWNGHLYNWYDVASCKPVDPYFVSTVDSGNFVAALIVCKEFCTDKGVLALAERCAVLADGADFSALTDKSEKKLYIGYNVGASKYEGHYDMLASEARLTAYVACAQSRDTTVWSTLSREQVYSHGNVLASWSGSAFEYLMPQLFLPDVNKSLVTESVKRACKTFASRRCNGYWGISESGYYAFDRNANYQYKAHGISDLALSGEQNKCVITPYASALAYRYLPEKALANLKKLASGGCYGDHGFFEALDFTSGKNTVSSYMTHHQGMILCALANALGDDFLIGYFTSDSRIAGALLMLEEREIPSHTARAKKRDFVYSERKEFSSDIELSEFPETCLLYGREYGVVIDDYGSGYSRWRDKDINVFSRDFYKNSGAYGYFICDGERFSPTFAPLKKDGGCFRATFASGHARFVNTKDDCEMKVYTPVIISGEVREFTVENKSDRTKNYEFVFAERIAMAGREEYASHPAFCDLFVGARFDKEKKTVYLRRRPRESGDGFSLAATMLTDADVVAECNRNNLYGRNSGDADPAFAFGGEEPSEGDVISPCLGLKCAFSLSAGQKKTIAVVIQCAESESALEDKVGQVLATDFLSYASRRPREGERGLTDKYLKDESTARYAGKLAAKVLYEPYPVASLAARSQLPPNLVFNEKAIVLRYDGNAAFTKKAVSAAIACRLTGADLRLVIVYSERDAATGETKAEICDRAGISDLESLHFVTFVDESAVRPADVKNLISGAFCVLKEWNDNKNVAGTAIAVRRKRGSSQLVPCESPRLEESGNGGFDVNGDYVVTSRPSAPYSNVVCARLGGFVATENGGGFNYFLNSRSDKLSGWSNDPVADPPSERVIVSDGTSVIRVNKLNKGGYVRHKKGATEYCCRTEKAYFRLRKSLAGDGRIISLVLDVRNLSDGRLTLEVGCFLEPCADHTENRSDVCVSEYGKDAVRVVNVKTGREFFLLAKNCNETVTDYSQVTSRGVNGYNPKRTKSPFNNPYCGANVVFTLAKKSAAQAEFALCDSEETLAMARNADLAAESLRCGQSLGYSPLSLSSPDRALNILYSNLPYQVLSSRMNGRCGFYQAGGAIGFRDQLQDCLALLWTCPERVREHILLCAERQYTEGDVMHWWHAPAFGVRTRITDDRLFLPYVVCEYVAHTGDESILSEKCGYLEGEPLENMKEARLEHGRYSGVKESLLLHMQRAIDSATVTGEHGLLLIGSGDWNDALNGIGMRGRGESVWLTQFAVCVIEKFCAYIDAASAKKYRAVAARLRRALEKAYIDGRWARAFTDDGEWLGVKNSSACKVDLICQCWAVIAGIGDEDMRKSCMSAAKSLVDEKAGAVKLFSPPFNGKKRYGYISSYPEGVRENGGQYTHAAVWYLLACCKAGDKEEANRVLRLLDPVRRCADAEKNRRYKGEPYVLAGDVYTNRDNVGRAGWTWYTGSAAWLYKVITEEMLGVKKRGDSLEFSSPLLDGAENTVLRYDHKGTRYLIKFENAGRKGLRTGGVNYTNCSTLALKENRGEVEVTVLY